MNTVTAILAALNPVLVLVLGWFLNNQLDSNTNAILAETKAIAETNAIELKGRVDKGTFIKTFIDDLSGDNERRRQLALQAIVVVMPGEAPAFLQIIAGFPNTVAALERTGAQATSPNANNEIAIRNAKNDAQTARDLLSGARAAAVEDMFSEQDETRKSALTALRRSYSSDVLLFDLLITRGLQESAQWAALPDSQKQRATPGLYNSVLFFAGARLPADAALKARIRDYVARLQTNAGPNTRTLAASTVKKFDQ